MILRLGLGQAVRVDAAWARWACGALLFLAPLIAGAADWEQLFRERKQWWSLQPVQAAADPKMPGNPTGAIDHFISEKLKEAGLELASPADKAILIRRLALVLTGLPPAPDEVQDFVRSPSPDAWERWVDRFLASPHFGERWARHWMDVVRFSETHGNEWNYEVHHAWRYRDYLIRAFNQDLPYDQLIREHIAGDLLKRPRWNEQEQFNESAIGTAFYRFGEVNHDDCISLRQIGYDMVDNQIDTLTKAFQATTVSCARCHDHKLDAVSMRDYHALLGVLRSSRQVSHTIDSPQLNQSLLEELTRLKSDLRNQMSELWLADTADLDQYLLAAQDAIDARPASAADSRLELNRISRCIQVLTNSSPDDPFVLWRMLHPTNTTERPDFSDRWKSAAARIAEQHQQAVDFNRTNFVTYADFRTGRFGDWQAAGHGLRHGPTASGDFALFPDGDQVIDSILPAGVFTHVFSQKLNGALRSPVLTNGIAKMSFQAVGRRSSALRIVSNNCQLNYKNYRALTNRAFQWISFSPPEDAETLRSYVELMTMLDNPKFPDQLSSLGGDPANYKLPWEKAAENPRSYFGITRAVIHTVDSPPKPELHPIRPLWDGPAPRNIAELAERYRDAAMAAVVRWRNHRATDDDVRWLDALLQAGLLRNSFKGPGFDRLARTVAAYRKVESDLAVPRVVPGLGDFGEGIDQPLLAGGDCNRPQQPVPRGYLTVLNGRFDKTEGSGRLQLAEAIANPNNPLTARVMVNRIWQHLFGEGIVRTVDDFGHAGELPSHPELLDYLAQEFMRERWSIKRLVRSIVLTKAFQASGRPSELAKQVDPLNRLLQHYPARRLEAESIRDAILAASGSIDRSMFGLSVLPFREKENADRRLFAGPLDGRGRRSVYIKVNLMETPKFLGAFNITGGKVCQGRRDQSNVPAQSLALLNDPFVLEQSERWARELVRRNDPTIEARIDFMFETTFGRLPQPDERDRFKNAAVRLAQLRAIPEEAGLKTVELWKDLAHAFFNCKEFIYIP